MNKNNAQRDKELFFLIKKDDLSAFKALFKKYYNNLCHFSNNIIKDRLLAEEAVSDVYMKIWNKRKQFNINISVKSYLYQAVRNYSLNYLKKKINAAENVRSLNDLEVKSDINTDDYLFYEEFKEKIDRLIDMLPKKRKLVFQLKYFDGMSFDEIAEILSISPHTVRNQFIKAVEFMNEQNPRLK